MKRAAVIIVGAGISALSAAQEMRKAGVIPIILEKSRGVGGRASTRRIAGVRVDHGAQFFTIRSESFRQQVVVWEREEVCSRWSSGFHRSVHGLVTPPTDSHPRYACADGMTAIAKAMSTGLDVEKQCRVIEVVRDEDEFRVFCEDGRVFSGERLILSPPVPQILEFATSILPSDWIRALKSIQYSPAFSVAAEIRGIDPSWKGLYVDSDQLAWVGVDFTKRRPRPSERYVVLHSTARFAQTHFDLEREEVGRRLVEEASRCGCKSLQLVPKDVHRWKFAKVEPTILPGTFLAEKGVYIVGDVFGGKIESAWLSGLAAAHHLLMQR